MTHEEWAEAERIRVQAAAVAHEHAVVAQAEPTPAADGDPLIAWLDAAPVTSSPAVALKVTAALRGVLALHVPHNRPSLYGPRCLECGEVFPCETYESIATDLGVSL